MSQLVGRQSGDGHQAQRGELGVLDQPVVFVAGPLHGGKDQEKSAFHGFSPAKTLCYKVMAKKNKIATPTLTMSRPLAGSPRSTICRKRLQVALEGPSALRRQTHGRVGAASAKVFSTTM